MRLIAATALLALTPLLQPALAQRDFDGGGATRSIVASREGSVFEVLALNGGAAQYEVDFARERQLNATGSNVELSLSMAESSALLLWLRSAASDSLRVQPTEFTIVGNSSESLLSASHPTSVWQQVAFPAVGAHEEGIQLVLEPAILNWVPASGKAPRPAMLDQSIRFAPEITIFLNGNSLMENLRGSDRLVIVNDGRDTLRVEGFGLMVGGAGIDSFNQVLDSQERGGDAANLTYTFSLNGQDPSFSIELQRIAIVQRQWVFEQGQLPQANFAIASSNIRFSDGKSGGAEKPPASTLRLQRKRR